MKLYNTLTRQKDELKPQSGNKFTMYACGPTVYNYAHIGNLRTYINEDILRRALKYLDFDVEEVMNITDIEDKIIKTANEQGIDYHEITKKYEKAFLADLTLLNIEKPEHMPRATEEIDGMIEIISGLLDKGYAYKSEDGSIYFSISKFKEYGKLAHLDFSGLKEGARVSQDEYDKENAQDFVLWKAKKEGEPSWPAPFGEGRPGWHIECSDMSMKYLGETVDIHAGAVDLIFPHHENEIAQSEAYTGKPFVKYWFHPEHLMVNGKKMSKSLGNIYTIGEVCEKYKVEPLAFRMLCLQANYREKLNFTEESIVSAQNTLNGLREFYQTIGKMTSPYLITPKDMDKPFDVLLENARSGFKKALEDDINMPTATAEIFKLIRELNKIVVQSLTETARTSILQFFNEIDRVLKIDIDKQLTDFSIELQKLLKAREAARIQKDYKESDRLRIAIKDLGYDVEDTNYGLQRIKKI